MPVNARTIVANSLIGHWEILHCLCTPHGKPESFVKRRMGVALAFDADVEVARVSAKLAASKVKPRKV